MASFVVVVSCCVLFLQLKSQQFSQKTWGGGALGAVKQRWAEQKEIDVEKNNGKPKATEKCACFKPATIYRSKIHLICLNPPLKYIQKTCVVLLCSGSTSYQIWCIKINSFVQKNLLSTYYALVTPGIESNQTISLPLWLPFQLDRQAVNIYREN